MKSRMHRKASLRRGTSLSLIRLKMISAFGLFPSFLVVFSRKSCVMAAVFITSAAILLVIVQFGANFEKLLDKNFFSNSIAFTSFSSKELLEVILFKDYFRRFSFRTKA